MLIGKAVVLKTFVINKGKNDETVVAGSQVCFGKLLKHGQFKVVRNGEGIHEQWGANEIKHFANITNVKLAFLFLMSADATYTYIHTQTY